MSKDKNTQEFVAANIKITKGMTQQARELGITHAAYRNKGVQKRLMREQKEIIKRQQRNENTKRKLIKEFEQDKAAKLKAAKQQQAEKEYLTVAERVLSVSPQPGPCEDVGGFDNSGANFKNMRDSLANPAETPEQAAKRVIGILGFDDQSEAASLENTYEACLDIKAERIKLKHVDIDIAATYPGPDTTPEELHEASRQVSSWGQGTPEETGIDPTLPFDDGTIDTNDDPKNFGVQSVDDNVEVIAELPTNEPIGRGFPLNPVAHDIMEGIFGGTCGGNRKQMYGNSKGQQPQVISKAVIVPELKENQVLVNLYGDENNYKPFPNIGDLVRPDGLLLVVHTVSGEPLSEKDLINLCEVDYVNDGLMFSDRVLHEIRAAAKQMFFDKHPSEATTEDISQTFPHHPQEDGPFSHAKFTEGVEGYKIQNSGVSGAFVDPASIHPVYRNRIGHQFDPLLEEKKEDSSDKE